MAAVLDGTIAAIGHDVHRRSGRRKNVALNGRCFDPHDIPSEEDLADASRTLQALAGTIAGTMTESEVDALTKRRAKAVNNEDVWTPSIVVSAQRDFDEAAMIVAAVNE